MLLLLAGVVVVLHLAFLGYLVLGGLLGLRDRRWLWPHAATVAWGLSSILLHVPCPLTSLEKWLVETGGGTPYDGPFITHYLTGTLYPPSAGQVVLLLVALVVLGSYVASFTHRRPPVEV